MNKKIKIITIILIIILLVVLLISNNIDKKGIDNKTDIISKIESKETFNIYLTSNGLENINNILSSYNKNYGLQYEEFNKSKEKVSDYVKLLKKLGMKENLITLPCFIIIENGIMKSNFVGLQNERQIKTFLEDNALIDVKKY